MRRRGHGGIRANPLGEIERQAPTGLSVDLIDEEFAVFAWDVETHDAARDLTPAERDVLARVVAGASNAEIAKARGTSIRTVANQIASLLRKLGASSRFDLTRRFNAYRPKT